ncbi:protein kinase subdomain-containing protein PKL CAK Fmp29 [Ramaria rubella]|nr:protein kinase subdomain-containing protein PKL CAK Fmp29 [Ramaria rubella]
MPCLGSARVLHRHPTRWPPRREYSLTAHLCSEFFEYASGRWIFNDDLRHAERRRIFKVDELSRLAAEAVNRSPDDIVRLEKLAEGGFNRTFLITMRCGFQMVARIPYPVTIPKYFAVASEVATMALVRSFGLPIPEVYGYSPTPNNAAGTEYILMEFVQGTNLSDIWPGITLEDKRFCVGPNTSLRLWYGRRSQLDLDRGPYESAEVALVRGAEKELAYLRRFGRPLLPFQRLRREAYNYQEQPPSDHIENLDRHLLIASSLIPRNPALGHFRIRHPDLQPSNIIISRSPDSNLQVVGLIDWQHTSILPLFLLSSIPQQLQNYDDTGWQSMTRPSLPEKLDDLDKTQQSGEMELYRRRLVHYHYVKNTEEYNELHYAALTDPMGVLRRRLFCHASDPWEGETFALKVALIQATKNWKTLTGGGPPCPIVFDPDNVREMMKLDAEQQEADESLEAAGCPVEQYERAMALSKKLKEDGLAATELEEQTQILVQWPLRAQIAAHWLLDDMDEEEYM